MSELAILLEVAYVAHLNVYIGQTVGRGSRRIRRDLETLLDDVVPEALAAHEGIDGQLVWLLAILVLGRRRRTVAAGVVQNEPEAARSFEGDRAWKTFRARLALSPAGLDWSHLQRCAESMRS